MEHMQQARKTDEELRIIQNMELEMLRELNRVCKKHGIAYSLYGGTLIGAMRNKGFIPWDDDADICMLREEYDKFVAVSHELNPEICYFQNHTVDPKYRWGYGKLRRTGTTFVRRGQEHLDIKTGVFMDIFPLDNIPRCLPGQMLNDFWCFILRKITWSEVGKLDKRCSAIERGVYHLLSRIPIDWVFRREHAMANKNRNNAPPQKVRTYFWPAPGKDIIPHPLPEKYGMPKEWFTELTECEFEGEQFSCIKQADAYLTYQYGDYMTPPVHADKKVHATASYNLGFE